MKKSFTILFICFFLCQLVSADYNPSVRIDPALDRFLSRMQARYGVSPGDIGRQPFETIALSGTLQTLSEHTGLSDKELNELRALSRYFDVDGGVLSWHDEHDEIHFKINLSLLGEIKGTLNDDALWMRGLINPRLSGNLGPLSFYSEVDVWTDYRSDMLFEPSTYQPYDGIPYNLYGRDTEGSHLRSSDLVRGGINYSTERIDLGLAVDYIKWGPAQFYPLTLSGLAPPITCFRTDLDLQIVQYQHITGLLQSQRDKRKYIYAHRLSGKWKQLEFSLNEVIINGSTTDQQPPGDPNQLRAPYYGEERQLEIAYMIPFLPKVILEHYLGDRDNAAISVDWNLTWPENFRFYGEIHLDDISAPWTIFSSDWGNKWGFTGGMGYYGRLLSKDFSAGIEYSRVEPWVYTHFYGGSHRYEHFNKPLGSPLGPNSRGVMAFFDLGVSVRNTVGITVNSEATNSSVRGGSIEHVFQLDEDSTEKEFLGPGTVHYLRPGIYWTFDPFGVFRINAHYQIDLREDKGRSNLRLYGGLYF